jgi:putative transposase
MSPFRAHRKLVRHYHEPGHSHELTFSCYQRRPLLTNELWRGMLSEAIDHALERHGYQLAAFVYMPEHVHLLVFPGHTASKIDGLLRAIKRPFSSRIKRLLEISRSPLLENLTIHQRPGVRTFRFWQEGPGYDRNLDRVDTVLAAIDYIHLNPVRRGVMPQATDWPWSSVRWYQGIEYVPKLRVPRLTRLPAEFLSVSSM